MKPIRFLPLTVAICSLALLSAHATFTLSPLYSFTSATTSGEYPYGPLVPAGDGNFYGTDGGGAYGYRTVFKITPIGNLTTLHDFDETDGAQPAGLLQGTRGNLYGTTSGDWGWEGRGTVFSLGVGLGPFVTFVRDTAKVEKWVEILGQGFIGTSGVSFNGTPAAFKVKSNTYLAATVPAGATTGPVTVTTPNGALISNVPFRVRPQILSFTPTSGPVETQVIITGVSLTQTEEVGFGGVPTNNFTVNSDTQVTATVPSGAQTGHIAITTLGGKVWSEGIFTVTQ